MVVGAPITALAFVMLGLGDSTPTPTRATFLYRDNSLELERILDSKLQAANPGAAIMVIRDKTVVFKKAYGVANVETGARIDEHTQFYIASLGKMFTATAVLLLRERGELSLETRLTDYFPSFPVFARDIRLYHLLTHTSGLPRTIDDNHSGPRTNAAVLTAVQTLRKPKFEPGIDFQYSNIAYVLLSAIVEVASGQSYADFVGENILEPLNMSETVVYDETRPELPNRAVGYTLDDGTFVVDDYENNSTTGPGGIYSTLHDLHLWHQTIAERRLLETGSWDLAFHMPYTLSGERSWMAMGWFDETFGPKTPDLNGMRAYGAIGVLDGFRAIIKMFPEYNLSYIVLSNCGQLPIHGSEVARIYLSQERR